MEKFKGYICTIAANHELGETRVTVYSSLAELKRLHPMYEECGVTEVEIVVKDVVIGAKEHE